jgi:hypothetical protein
VSTLNLVQPTLSSRHAAASGRGITTIGVPYWTK